MGMMIAQVDPRVNKAGPISGPLINEAMRLVGRTEVASFLRRHPDRAETLGAWVAEIHDRTWSSAEALSRDYRGASVLALPKVVFHLGDPPTVVETLVDFRNGILMVTSLTCEQVPGTSVNRAANGAAARD